MGKRNQDNITAKKNKLWKVFSLFIRMRDCLEATGTLDDGCCCTCNRPYTRANLQAGHFIPGREDSILFDPTCVHSQCYRCNVVRSGEWVKYFRFMEKKYGRAYVFDLMAKSEKKCLITVEWIELTTVYYLNKIEQMEAEHG